MKYPSLASLSQFGLASIGVLMLWFGYWAFWPVRVIQITGPLHLMNAKVFPGDLLVIQMDYCKAPEYNDLEAMVYLSYSNLLIYPVSGASMEKLVSGCHTTTIIQEIPRDLPPGTYTLSMIRVYVVNPLRRFIAYATSDPLTVLAREE